MGDHERRSNGSLSKSSSKSLSPGHKRSSAMHRERSNEKSLSRSRSITPVKRKKSKNSKSRSRSPRKRKHSRKYSPSRSRSRSYRKYSRSRSRDRRSSYDDKRDYSRSRYRRSPSRSPLSRRRRHRGDRDNPKESKCIGVFGMSLHTDERTIREVFDRYGPIEEVQIVYDYHTGRSRGFAFVYYKYLDDAIDAKENAPGVEIDGHKIRVDYSITERAHTPTPGTYLGFKGGSYRGDRGGDVGRRYRPSPSPQKRSSRYRSYSRSPSRGVY